MPQVAASQAPAGTRASDGPIVAGLRAGDPDSLERLVREYGRLIASWAAGGDTEDVVQDVLLSVWRTRATLDPQTSLPPLLKTITGNAVRNRWRTAARKPSLAAGLDPAGSRAGRDDIGPRTERIAISQMLENLAPRERQVLELLYLFDVPQAEVAQRLESSVDAVKSLAARARRRLRAELQASGDG